MHICIVLLAMSAVDEYRVVQPEDHVPVHLNPN